MISLGLDIGSSSIKATLFDAVDNKVIASATSPSHELPISAPHLGWAEQSPQIWWDHVVLACAKLRDGSKGNWSNIKAIGIAYQMHGLVLLDRKGEILRPAIIWCDSRAVDSGRRMLKSMNKDEVLRTHLNTPSNFTASKMAWVKEYEPDTWGRVHTAFLPGDYIAWRLSGSRSTTATGLSEMILWDFEKEEKSDLILNHIDIAKEIIPDVVPSLGFGGELSTEAAVALGLQRGVQLTYRSGDQPNNAFGLGVNDPGSVGVNAGTSGVVYAVTETSVSDPRESFNAFLHVNHLAERPRVGLLLCVNGCGIMNAQIKKLTSADSYEQMNSLAAKCPAGSDGLRIVPFGNGAERILGNSNPGASIRGWDFNHHDVGSFYRASLEGIAVSLSYGLDRMRSFGVRIETVRAGEANLFKSPVFREIFAEIARVNLDLYSSDGATAAARGAALGAGFWSNTNQMAEGLECIGSTRYSETKENKYDAFREEMYLEIESLVNKQTN